jgi:UDP-glucose 4-epimerase
MKVLVTGVAGFLGSNLLDRLLTEGHEVVGIDNLAMGSVANIESHLADPSFTFVEADITCAEAFENLDDPVDCIVHLAAFKIPRYGKAIETLKVNYEGASNALDHARRLDVKCVLASTSDVYGRNPELPFSEATSDAVIGSSKSPRWAYAVSKLFDEHLALAYSDAYGFPVTLLRFFGSYGPRQHLSWWGGPPPVFIDLILRDKPVPIHGDGRQTRTFTYVSDTIDGIYRATIDDAANGEILNIGGNEEISILDFARLVKQVIGTPGSLEYELVPYESFTGKAYEDVMRRVPDTSFAESLIGFKAEVPLEEGLKQTVEWQRELTT